MLKHKNKIKTPHEHLDIVCRLFVVGSPDVNRNTRLSEVPTSAGSPGALGLSRLARLSVGSPDGSRKSQQSSRVPTICEQAQWTVYVNSVFALS